LNRRYEYKVGVVLKFLSTCNELRARISRVNKDAVIYRDLNKLNFVKFV